MNDHLKNITASSGQLSSLFKVADLLIGKEQVKSVFEFGSRYGEDTVEFAKYYPQASIYSFECNPKSISDLKQRIRPYNNIVFNENAISDKTELIEFYQIDETKTKTTWADGNQGASSIFKASGNYPVEEYVQTKISVQAITLCDFLNQHQIEGIDVMWMDIQGAELKALQGLREKIHTLKIVHLEVEFIKIYDNQPLFKDLDSFFKSQDFYLLGFSSKTNYSGDAVYVNRRHYNNEQIAAAAALLPAAPSGVMQQVQQAYFKLKYAGFILLKRLGAKRFVKKS